MPEIVDIQSHLHEKWIVFLWSLALGLIALWIAWKKGLFKPFYASNFPVIRGIDVLKGFVFFLFAELLLIPTLIGLYLSFAGKDPEIFLESHYLIKGWLHLLVMFGGFGAVCVAYFELKPDQRQQIWHQTSETWYYQFGLGMATWFLCYPLVIAFSQVTSIAAWCLFHHSFVEQVAVQHLRKTLEDPFLFLAMGVAVITIIPITEEFLFRGLLQSWLKRKTHHTIAAIGLSSLVFAFFHYSSDQGVTNIELLSSLFLLSCMLGFIYERQRSLWAPIGLHSFFNFMSLLMISKE